MGVPGCPLAQTDISTHWSHGVTQISELQKVRDPRLTHLTLTEQQSFSTEQVGRAKLRILLHYNCVILSVWKFSEISIPIVNLGLTDF